MRPSVIRKPLFYFIAPLLNYSLCFSQAKNVSPIPSSSRQMILVITKSFEASDGILFRFERDSANTDWEKCGNKISVIVGKNGIAWGRGLHKLDSTKAPVKKEGDGKSPAGVFTLSTAFGYYPIEKIGNLKIPYIYVTDMLECVDGVDSKYYNSLVFRDKIENIDWHSSEKMLLSGIWYELGVIVDHNKNPAKKGAGSCIFLHNWDSPADSTSGCTAMAPSDMKDIVYWLDASKNPILVQITKQIYTDYKRTWGLPNLLCAEK
jgi:D-alanyl-D-alanine dipeptidase